MCNYGQIIARRVGRRIDVDKEQRDRLFKVPLEQVDHAQISGPVDHVQIGVVGGEALPFDVKVR